MFGDYNGKLIECRKNSKTTNLTEAEVQTSMYDLDLVDQEIQCVERIDQTIQTDYKEILKLENLKINEKNLEIFLKNVKITFNSFIKSLKIIEDSLNGRSDEILECKGIFKKSF